ncbi:Uncharacterised protein [Mycobacteroides abscessus subsp. abscessus]|nr:Uncharacterised protein [Mycobacteroides abscessus subsp. abscessus]
MGRAIVGLVEDRRDLRVVADPLHADGQPRLSVGVEDGHQPVDRGLDPLAQGAARQIHRVDLGHDHHGTHDFDVEVALGAEIVVQQPARHSGLTGELGHLHRRVGLLTEHPDGDSQDFIAPGVGAESAPTRFICGGHSV